MNEKLIKIAEQAGFDVQVIGNSGGKYHIGFGCESDDVELALTKFAELISIKALLLERIKYYILMNGGGEDHALGGMRFESFRDYCAETFFSADISTKQGRSESRKLKLADVMTKITTLEEHQLLNILEMVIRRAFRQM